MTDSQHFALELIAAFIAMCLVGWIMSAFRDGWRNANRTVDTGIVLALDPLDETWATVIRDESTPIGDSALLIAETETWLRGAS